MNRKWIWLAAVCGALALAGGCNCGNPEPNPNPGGEDAGGEPDGGAIADAGDGDSGVEMDAGETDAGDLDGGMELDGGEMDAGMELDAGMMDAGVMPSTICADVAKKKCDFFIRCRTDNDPEPRFGNTATLNQGRGNDQVTATMRAECEAFETDVGCQVLSKSWEKGRSIVDQAKYDACIDAAYPANTCARDLNDVFTSCLESSFLKSNTPNGSLCSLDEECTAGYCAKTGMNACGTCTAYVALGQNCNSPAQCDPATQFCNQGGNCTNYVPSGGACQLDEQCGPGNVCQASTGNIFQRTCKAGVPLGGACTGGHFECARTAVTQANPVPSAICSSQNGAGTCIEVQSAVGGICGTGERFNPLTMQRGPICNETEVCLAAVCSPRRTAGLPCTSTDQCAFGTYCDNMGGTASNTCVAYKDEAVACANSAQCKNFMSCQGATCQPVLGSIGSACNAMQLCAEGYCDAATNMCTALKADGAMCTNGTQCQSTTCMGGSCVAACWQ